MFFALLRKRPIDCTYGMRPSTPSATIAAGVLATGKSFAVALFTPLSVACADSTTATSSSNGVRCSSSERGIRIGRAQALEDRAALLRIHGLAGASDSPCGDRGEPREPRRLVRGEIRDRP